MKRILFFFSLLISVVAFSQPTTNYQRISTPYDWRHGRFDSVLATPYGQTPTLRQVGGLTRPGPLFLKTLDGDTSLKVWTGYRFIDVGGPVVCTNKLLTEWSVSWQGSGFNFSVHGGLSDGTGSYQIGCSFYTADSATVTFDPSDDDKERIDIIYLDETGVHVLKGDTAVVGTALKPSLESNQIELSFILISPGTTLPTLTQLVIYNENAGESTVTNTGTTTDPDNTTNVFIGTKSVNVTNINDPSGGGNIDAVYFDKLPGGSSWNVLGFDGVSFAIKLKAVMPGTGNLGISLGTGTEVIIPLVKSNITTYQQISIPISSFGNITNTNITRVRVRYIRSSSTANYTGFYLDYIYFVDGVNSPPTSTVAQFTFNPPVGFNISPSATQQSPGVWTMTPNGTAGQYYTPSGWTTFPTFSGLGKVGVFEGRSPTADGAVIDGDSIYFWPVDYTFPGMTTPAMKMKWDSSYYISNTGVGDTLAWPLNDSTTGIKSLIAGTGITITPSGSALTIASTGGGGASRFGQENEDTAQAIATTPRIFQLNDNSLNINKWGNDPEDSITFRMDGQHINLKHNYLSGLFLSEIDVWADRILFNNNMGNYQFTGLLDTAGGTRKMVIWDSVTNKIFATAIPSGGGGTVTDVLGTANRITSTGGTTPDIDISATFEALLGKVANPLSQFAATTSAQLAGVLSDENGTAGGFVRGTSPSITTPTIVGTITTADPAHTGTTPSGAGVVGATMFIRPTSDFTLANSATDQTAFGSALDVWTLQASTSYYFEGEYYITSGAVSHSISMGFTIGGSLTSINYSTLSWPVAVNTQTASQTTAYITQAASTAVNAAAANAVQYVKFSGWMNVNAGGTVTPIIKFSADPTGTCLMKAGSYIKFTPMGANTIESIGNVN